MHIQSAQYIVSNPSYDKCPKPDKTEYAFIGRSNVGKSSLINMLCNNQKLAKTSANPGKTQLINHFLVTSGTAKQGTSQWYLVDLPGYGFAKIAQSTRRKWEQMIEGYLRKRENLTNVFVLIDSRHEPQKIDLEFVNKLGEWEVPFSLVFTKADKEKPGAVDRHVRAFLDKMRETWQFLPPHVVTSAEKKTGKEDLLNMIEEMNVQVREAQKENNQN